MSRQGVRTHHRMATEVNDPDSISGQDMLSSGCDVHECLVLLPEGVRIEERATCPLGESGWSCSGQRRVAQLIPPREEFCPTDVPPSPDISHLDGKGGRSVRRHFTSGYLTAGWERRTLQLLRIDISGPFDNAYPQSFSLSIQCNGVLLKLPDISNRHLEIFCFRYLLSKSPKSPCNPPIIGFLSL